MNWKKNISCKKGQDGDSVLISHYAPVQRKFEYGVFTIEKWQSEVYCIIL